MAKDWNIKTLYYYLVCLVTLFLVIGGFIATINSAVSIMLPDKPNVPIVEVYYPYYRGEIDTVDFAPPPLSELETIRAEREEMYYYSSWMKRRLLNAIAFMVIPAPFYLLHWKKVKPLQGRVD